MDRRAVDLFVRYQFQEVAVPLTGVVLVFVSRQALALEESRPVPAVDAESPHRRNSGHSCGDRTVVTCDPPGRHDAVSPSKGNY